MIQRGREKITEDQDLQCKHECARGQRSSQTQVVRWKVKGFEEQTDLSGKRAVRDAKTAVLVSPGGMYQCLVNSRRWQTELK